MQANLGESTKAEAIARIARFWVDEFDRHAIGDLHGDHDVARGRKCLNEIQRQYKTPSPTKSRLRHFTKLKLFAPSE